ncbi:hypothetical protein SD71_07840 [Cohnella kolymensis]|uniref:HTH cro/C1-type domain-containing protein n=1 Tax=Cohnella kolymensis TaxID=1590652 RepID=A0ABR5A6J0_9BACL|nr:helix-turn-helix transcriptional regulator [Cohnella kolymensis]KIL36383.1 hypothetical protein SD71_07840 [Cohnella kolymensis]
MELARRYLRLLESESKNMEPSLRNAREAAGYSVEYVANALNISTRTLYKYERYPASIYVSTAIKLARFYGVTLDELSFS